MMALPQSKAWRSLAASLLMSAAATSLVLPVRAAEGAALAADDARAWLLRMNAAATQRNYEGTFVVSASGQMSSSRVSHFCEGKQSYEKVELLDGLKRHWLRHNDQVITLWPASKSARVEQRDGVAQFPAVLSAGVDQLIERYEMVAEGPARVAGHDAAMFLLQPRDGWRFAQRLWADQASGLVLRADVVAPDGRILETSAFTDVSIGIKAQAESVLGPMKNLEGYRVARPAQKKTTLESEGWRLQVPVGFREVSCVRRSLDHPADERGLATGEVVHAIYSDGLTHVSVFIEPQRGDGQRAGQAAVGATHTMMMPLGPHWVTVMGDVPYPTLKQFAAALERRP
jgi:sigma-E factor negative regulatory protein RseB